MAFNIGSASDSNCAEMNRTVTRQEMSRHLARLVLGRSTYETFVTKNPNGIPIKSSSHYQDKILAHYTKDGVINHALIEEERWSEEQIRSYIGKLTLHKRIMDIEVRMFIPRGEEILYFIRKGFKKEHISPWPYLGDTVSSHSAPKRSTVETPPVDFDIVASFRRDNNLGRDVFCGYTFPDFDNITLHVSTREVGVPLVNTVPHDCLIKRAGPSRFPSDVFDTDENDTTDNSEELLRCSSTRPEVRATDCLQKHVHSLKVKINTEVPVFDKSTCHCIECVVDNYKSRCNAIKHMTSEFPSSLTFAKKQSLGCVIYAPNASGKTTSVAILRSKGYAAFEASMAIDWYAHLPHMEHSIIFTTHPALLHRARYPIAILPTKRQFDQRIRFRKRFRPDLREFEPYHFKYPRRTSFIMTNKRKAVVLRG